MNEPAAPGRIRWAILCLALATGGALPAAAGASSSRGDVIVQMDAGRSAAAAKAEVREDGGKVTGDLPIINGFGAKLSQDAADRLEDADGVKAVTVDNAVKPQGINLSRLQTAYPASVDAPQLWNYNVTGKGVGAFPQLTPDQVKSVLTSNARLLNAKFPGVEAYKTVEAAYYGRTGTANGGLTPNEIVDPVTGEIDYTRSAWSRSSWSAADGGLTADFARSSWSRSSWSSTDYSGVDVARSSWSRSSWSTSWDK